MEKPVPRERGRRREFTADFKADVVSLCGSGSKSIGQLCRELDLSESVVRRWIAQADIDNGKREGLTTSEREELAQLRRENRALREERDFLKRAAAFFARETR